MNEVDIVSTSIKALSSDTRERISLYLNVPDDFLSGNGYARDYRGLAELLGFDYPEIRNFSRCKDPTSKILEMYEKKPSATIGELINFLKKMDRGDVLQDCHPRIKNDVAKFLKGKNLVQVPLATSCFTAELRANDSDLLSTNDASDGATYCSPTELRTNDSDVLSTNDASNGEFNIYDAYICHADEDLKFVLWLTDYLESFNFKVFLPCRNLLSGHLEQVALIQLIKDRCHRMLVILSPAFSKSPSCVFQANFAATLAIDYVQRITIPILIAPCEIPLIFSTMSKVDFTKSNEIIQKWILPKLILSIKNVENSTFLSQANKNTAQRIERCIRNEALPLINNNLAIEFPPSGNNLCSSGVPALTSKPVPSAPSSSATGLFNRLASKLSIHSVPASTTTRPSIKESKYMDATSETI